MDKKIIDIQENIIDTENYVPEEKTESAKITYKAEKSAKESRKVKKYEAPAATVEDDEDDFLTSHAVNKTHKRRMAVGAVMCILMLIGIGTIIAGGVKVTAKIFDNTEEKNAYNAMLSTFVIADPLPFETPDQADQDWLLSSCVWAAVMNEDMAQYEKNDFGETYLPAVEVEKYFTKVFGTQHTLSHRSFADQEVEFQYDEEKQAYIVPVTSFPTGFTPQVAKIKKGNGEKIVTVGYISPSTSWTDSSDGSISKYVDYIFQKQGQSYCLVAIRESEMKVEITATDSQAQ